MTANRTRIAAAGPAPRPTQARSVAPPPPPAHPIAAQQTRFFDGTPPAKAVAEAPAPPIASAPVEPESALASTRLAVPRVATEDDASRPTKIGEPRARIGTVLHGTQGLAVPDSEAPKVRLLAGKVVPGTRYRIVRWLGEGGMGVVYEAEHIDIERRVALKILRFDLSQQPKMVQVFREEARAASRLGSRYIVEVYDFGELPDGRLFFAMELLQGHDLVPDPGSTCDPGRVIGILRQVCKGLHAAHRAGVVHRDVKPENIIATIHDGRRDAMKIVDFGISAMLAAGPGSEQGGIAGTPHYMAPEQILGHRFDARLDIYALGCTAYELLTGKTPFEAQTLDGLLHKHITAEPPPLRQTRPDIDVPPALEAVIMKCLAKDPNHRWHDMADLEAALCEAQIAAGLQTIWDDLPIPELADLERRERLLRDMPSLVPTETPKRKLLWPLVAVGSTMLAAGLGALLFLGTAPTDEEKGTVETLTLEARDAASRTHWVFPPPSAPASPTAFAKVLELEGLSGSIDAVGDERALELRTEFADTLVGHADQLWDNGATKLARDYYLAALVFEPNNAHAFERAGTSMGLLADFIDRARRGEFSEAELILAQLAAAEVTDDPAAREALLLQADAAMADAELAADAELVLAKAVVRARGRRPADVAQPAVPVEPPPMPVPEEPAEAAEPEEVVLDEPLDPTAAAGEPSLAETPDQAKPRPKSRRKVDAGPLGMAARDPVKARELAEQGASALAAGRRQDAESLFNQAIAYDRSNAAALMGLSDIYFDTGAATKAVLYAERAVSASPQNQNYRLKLGDAYYKVLRYTDALEQYERAQKLGSPRAQDRIAKIKAKLGQ